MIYGSGLRSVDEVLALRIECYQRSAGYYERSALSKEFQRIRNGSQLIHRGCVTTNALQTAYNNPRKELRPRNLVIFHDLYSYRSRGCSAEKLLGYTSEELFLLYTASFVQVSDATLWV